MNNVNLTAQLTGPNEIVISGYNGLTVIINEKVMRMIVRVCNESEDMIEYLTEALELFIRSRGEYDECSDLFLQGCRLLVATKSFIEDINELKKNQSNKEEEDV